MKSAFGDDKLPLGTAIERALKIARGEPLVIDGEAEWIGEVNN